MLTNTASSRVKYRLMYSARLLALAVITASGITFLMWSGLLLWLLFEMPGIITREEILTNRRVRFGLGVPRGSIRLPGSQNWQ
jgi:hypothetical protein